ncbi:MAG: hypothetical protein ABSG54_19505 [Terriglobia bacterium]|jgi:hypothetical protein
MEPISSGISVALATLRLLKEIAKDRKQADIDEKLQIVYDVVFNMQHGMFNLEDEARRLRAENEQLKSTKDIESQLTFDGKVYWRTVDNKKNGPFCPNCWHDPKSRQLVPLQHLGGEDYFCSRDKTEFRRSSAFASAVVGPPRFPDKF